MKNKMGLVFRVVLVVLIIYLIYNNYYTIFNNVEYLYIKFFQPNITQILVDSDYRKKVNYEFIQINEDTTIKNKTDIKNTLYTFLDGGWKQYTVSCDLDYLNCFNDFKLIIDNSTFLTDLSNYVHPFNSFNKVNTTFMSNNRIILKKENKYSNNQISIINNKVNEIYNKYYDPNKSQKDNIKTFHDYIINNTKYDNTNTKGTSDINSSTAYGVMIEGLGICSGYADAMALFLDKMNIPNYKISSDTHVWNFVYVDGTWLHLDLTWDDPLTYNGASKLVYDYFLITTDELEKYMDNDHNFDKTIYLEAN